jgi:uncharacterized protein
VKSTSLLDVNVLVALFDPDHVHHELAHDWFADHGRSNWATCPLTENGFVRVLANPAYGATVNRVHDLVDRLLRFRASGGHVFWEDSVSLLDASLLDWSAAVGHRQLTDIYLLALACARGGRLVTFDRSIPLRAVKGATAKHLVVVGPASRS